MTGLFLFGVALLVSYFFEKEVIAQVTEKINKQLKEEVSVSEVNFSMVRQFPNASLVLSDVFIPDGKDTLISCKTIYLNFSPFDLITDNYSINSIVASEGLVKIRNGKYPNYRIWKSTESAENTQSNIRFKSIGLDEIQLKYTENGEFETNIKAAQFKLDWKEQKKEVKGNIDIDYFSGFDIVLTDLVSGFAHLDVETMDLTAELQWLSTQIKSNANLNPATFFFNITDLETNLGDITNLPFIPLDSSLSFISKNHLVHLNGLFKYPDFTNPTFSGVVTLDGFPLNTPIDDFLFTGNLHVDYSGEIAIKTTNPIEVGNTDNKSIAFLHIGSQDLQKGPINFDVKAIKNRIQISEFEIAFDALEVMGSIAFIQKNIQLNLDLGSLGSFSGNWNKLSFSGPKLELKNNQIKFKTLRLNAGRETLELRGEIELKNTLNDLKFDVFALSEELNPLEWLNLLGNSATGKKEKPLFRVGGKFGAEIARLNAGGIILDKVQCSGSYYSKQTRLDHFQFALFNGQAHGKASLVDRGKKQIFTSRGEVENVDIPLLFKGFKNFNQTEIQAKHISGIGSAKYTLTLDLMDGFNLDSESVFADVEFTIKDGALKNVPILQGMGRFIQNNLLLKKALDTEKLAPALANLQLSALANKITLKSGKLNIPKMQVKSNALDINISGSHSLENELDYHFDFRLQDILMRKKGNEFGYFVADPKEGTQVFIQLKGTPENPKFSFDKDKAKAFRKIKKQEEKQNIKDVFKREFSKKDPTEETNEPEIRFEIDTTPDPVDPISKKDKKEGKLSRFFRKLAEPRDSVEMEEKDNFEFEDDDL
ncbi:MAG: hypothetical protein ACJAY8_001237 [Sphingobacteriales bacterium]|jgi:hypothetical protein